MFPLYFLGPVEILDIVGEFEDFIAIGLDDSDGLKRLLGISCTLCI